MDGLTHLCEMGLGPVSRSGSPVVFITKRRIDIAVFGFREYFCLGVIRAQVTPGAVLGRHDSRDRDYIFFCSIPGLLPFIYLVIGLTDIQIKFFSQMTVQTGDIGTGMPAGRPIGKQPGMFFFVAFDAGDGPGRHGSFNPIVFDFGNVHLLGTCSADKTKDDCTHNKVNNNDFFHGFLPADRG